MIYEVYWDNFNVELYNKIKKIKMVVGIKRLESYLIMM